MARDLRKSFAAQARMARERFLEGLRGDNASATEAAVLKQCLASNTETVFGREHDFASLDGIDAYRARVPIRHYNDLEPWIDRAAEGEPHVLTHEEPVRFWKTTGTTSKSKKVPVTPASASRVTESFLALQGTQLHYYPELNERSDTMLYAHISPKTVKERLGGKFPYCSTTEVPVEVKRGMEEFVAPWMQPLQDVVEDDAERLYFLICFAALHDLFAIGCLHPSRFQTVVNVLAKDWPRVVKEIRDGTILGKPAREPRPARAKELEDIATKNGTLLPRDIWPNLKFLSSWSGSYISRYMPLMDSAYGVDFIPMPSISSECFMTMAIDKDRIGQPLNLRGGVFEFVPSGDPVEPGTKTLLFHELSEGATYEVILTTLGGLYRYAMCDVFRVTGFIDRVPRLEYVGRRAVSDLTGEKLAEEQVVDSVRATLAEHGLPSANYTVCGIQDVRAGERPHYVLVLEADAAWPTERAADVAKSLDARFLKVNSRYELKRNFNDLDPVLVEVVPPGTFAAYRKLLISRGMPAGQLKDKILHPIGGPVLADFVTLKKNQG